MAIAVDLEKDNQRKTGFVGFSWTTLFFNFFVPLFRKDWAWAFTILGTQIALHFIPVLFLSASSDINMILGSGVVVFILQIGVCIYFAAVYNKKYTQKLLSEGWKPVGDKDRAALNGAGLLSE